MPPFDVLHVLATARRDGAAIVKIIAGLADHLPPEKYRLHACFLGGDGPLAGELRRHNVSVSVVNWLGGVRNPAGALRFVRYLRRQPASIVDLHYGGRSVTWLSKRMRGARVTFHLHATENEGVPLRPILIHNADVDAVIANSRATADTIRHPRVTVIYPGIEAAALRDRPPPGALRVVGAAGRLVRIKGFAVLIDAFALVSAAFPDVTLEIAGSGPETRVLEDRVKRLGLEPRVRFLGWVDELTTACQRWEIFAQPSLSEGFGLSILEAMVNRLPVVASNVGGIPELVEDGVTGLLVPPGEARAFATALEQLLRDSSRARSMGERGRERALHGFSASLMASRVEALYDSLLV